MNTQGLKRHRIAKAGENALARGKGVILTEYDCGAYALTDAWKHSPNVAERELSPGSLMTVRKECVIRSHHRHNDDTNPATRGEPFHVKHEEQNSALETVEGIIAGAFTGTSRGVRVAAEQITAAYYLIPRASLPDVPGNAMRSNAVTVGPWCFAGDHDKDLAKKRKELHGLAAWVSYLEEHEAMERSQAAVARSRRREKIIEELAAAMPASDKFPTPAKTPDYAEMPPFAQAAVDRIIDLAETIEAGTE